MTPKTIAAGIATTTILVAASFLVPDAIKTAQVSALPDNERLQAAPTDIIAISDETADSVTYTFKTKPIETPQDELVERRTAVARTYERAGQIQVYFDAVTPYYQDETGAWFYTANATTTPSAFDLQTTSFLGTKTAYAQTTTFLTGSPGTGNQTWSVPADWNNSNNQVACIGSGGGGGKDVNGAGSGGGGAYASTTNITLTPGGTAIYAIGASATTSESTTSPAMARETYFNGTASSSASLSCSWGKKAGIPTLTVETSGGLGGAAGLSTGTTKFSGGNSGGSFNSAGLSATGGGGSAGMYGAGKNGGNDSGTTGFGGGGGGGSNGRSSTNGVAPITSSGGNGGPGAAGTGGGLAPGGGGTVNAGAGGGGGANTGAGGAGSCDQSFDSTHGACGGGGGAGASGAQTGGAGGTYGGGGGGTSSGTRGVGGQGLIVIIYTPTVAAAAQADDTYFELMNN